MPTVYAFRWVPPLAQGLVRDLRVRWALEEAGMAYDTKLLDQGDQRTDLYRALQPFGQVPAYSEDELTTFESGAIVLQIAEKSEALLPADTDARARARTWLFAALNTIEPPIQELGSIDFFHAGEPWTQQRRPQVEDWVRTRLAELEARLKDRDYLEDQFTAGDLMMVTVLRILRQSGIVADYPALTAYVARCEARPAFRKALADHMAPFEELAAA